MHDSSGNQGFFPRVMSPCDAAYPREPRSKPGHRDRGRRIAFGCGGGHWVSLIGCPELPRCEPPPAAGASYAPRRPARTPIAPPRGAWRAGGPFTRRLSSRVSPFAWAFALLVERRCFIPPAKPPKRSDRSRHCQPARRGGCGSHSATAKRHRVAPQSGLGGRSAALFHPLTQSKVGRRCQS